MISPNALKYPYGKFQMNCSFISLDFCVEIENESLNFVPPFYTISN